MHARPRAGNRLVVVRQAAFEQGRDLVRGREAAALHRADEHDECVVELCVVDGVVLLVVQRAVDIAQKLADLVDRQRALQRVDDQDAAELAARVLALLRRGEKAAAHPVLHDVRLKPCDLCYLREHEAPRQEHGG